MVTRFLQIGFTKVDRRYRRQSDGRNISLENAGGVRETVEGTQGNRHGRVETVDEEDMTPIKKPTTPAEREALEQRATDLMGCTEELPDVG